MPPTHHPINQSSNHLSSLRSILLRTLLVMATIAIIAYTQAETLLTLLTSPLTQAGIPAQLVTLRVAELFWVYIQLASWAGLLLGAPWLMLELGRFIHPALYPHERTRMWATLAAIPTLFYAGAALALWGVIPFILQFMLGFQQATITRMVSVQDYISMAGTLMLAFGATFWMPLILLAAVALGLITPQGLRTARRWVIVGIFIVAGIATPPDPVSQLLLALPLVALYELTLRLTPHLSKK